MTLEEAKRRRAIGLVKVGVAVVGTLVAGSMVSSRIFEPPPRAAVTPRAAPSGPIIAPAAIDMAFRVASASGKVEAFRDGRWVPIKPGDTLNVQDVVRTAGDAGAVLRRGPTMEFELRSNVEARLDRLTADAASFDVIKGKVVGGVGRVGQRLEVTARETRSVNDGVARFVVMLDEKGRVDVASTSGKTKFTAQGKEVVLDEGTESHAEPGKEPAEPEKIPEDVLLSVIWPGDKRDDKARVTGQVRPRSVVKVNGVLTTVGPTGQFVASVPLREGANKVDIEAEELSGLTKRVSNVLKRHTKGPSLEAEPGELWKK